MEAKGYTFFDNNKRFNINLVGVRRNNSGTNKFDDFMVVMYKNENLKPICKVYPITTDPGEHWLENPLNALGTAVLIPGQYRSAWKIGKHQGKYKALVQRKPVAVWRDNNKDAVIDYEDFHTPDVGYHGINIHRSNPYTASSLVDRWSAGCQVFKVAEDYNEFLDLCQESGDLYGGTFSYTLLTEEELRNHLDS
jgi:hypothetical protein